MSNADYLKPPSKMTAEDKDKFIENLGMEAYDNYMNQFDDLEGGSRPAVGKREAIKKVDKMARRHQSLSTDDRIELIKSLRVLYPDKSGSDMGIIAGKVTTGRYANGFSSDDWEKELSR